MCEFAWRQVVCPCPQGRVYCSQICYGVIEWGGRDYHVIPHAEPFFAEQGHACTVELRRLRRRGVPIRDPAAMGLGRMDCPFTEAYLDLRDPVPIVATHRCNECRQLCLRGNFRPWGF